MKTPGGGMTATTATTVIASAGWFQTFTKQTSYRSPSMFCHHQLFSLSLSLATHISTPYAYEKYLAYLVGRDRHHVVHVVPGHPERLSSRGSHRRPVREQAHLHHIASKRHVGRDVACHVARRAEGGGGGGVSKTAALERTTQHMFLNS